MTTEEIRNRIAKKEEEVKKLSRRFEEEKTLISVEESNIIERFLVTGDRSEYREYLKSQNKMFGGEAWHKAGELFDAMNCLKKYEKQLEVEKAKEATFSNIPEVLKQFREDVISRWDSYDQWKRDTIKKEYSEAVNEEHNYDEWREFNRKMFNKWGQGWYDFRYLTNEQIHNKNVKDSETIILNLINRVSEITGTFTDCKGLHLDSDNSGYAIINGIVIGEKGKAKIESIGAGGYNIQRYHIRVLVKEVR